jgi:hypothetical protein
MAEALSRVERLLFETPVLESFMARREAGRADADDVETAGDLAEELVSHQSASGSWGDSLGLTADALLLLSALRPVDRDLNDAVPRALQWLRSRQRSPGGFGDECEPGAHAAGFCHHFVTGFYSPGPRSVSFAGASLTNGLRFPSDADARLALSAYALRAALEHRAPTRDDELQLDALRRIADILFREGSAFSLPAALTVLTTLARARRTPGRTASVHGALSRLSGLQRGDGSWPGVEPFHVAETFLIAAQAGYGSPLFDAAIQRTAESLVLSQQRDGSWSQNSDPYRMLIAWRTLRHAERMRSQ